MAEGFASVSLALALLQGGVGGALLLVLFLVMLGGAVLAVAVVGGRIAPSTSYGGERREKSLFPARALCVLGLGFAVVGAFFIDISTNVLGMVLGMMGYFLGSRNLGIVVVALSIATLIIGLLIGQGAIPGSYGQPVDGISRPSSGG